MRITEIDIEQPGPQGKEQGRRDPHEDAGIMTRRVLRGSKCWD